MADPSIGEALRQVVAAGLRVRHTVARAAGITETDLLTLEHLVAGPVGPADLGRLLDVSTAASTGIVDRLAARGHVERRPHPSDRRRTEVHLTDSGRAEVRTHLVPMFAALRRLEEQLDPAERDVVRRYLEGALDAFETVAGRAADPADPRRGQ